LFFAILTFCVNAQQSFEIKMKIEHENLRDIKRKQEKTRGLLKINKICVDTF